MKTLVAFILTLSFCKVCFSQTDTIRIYVYSKKIDSWKVEVKNNKTYSLYNSLLTRNDFTAKGYCIVTDTTFQFLYDTLKLKNKNLAKDRLKQFSNLPYILTGAKFKKQETFFIPHNINYRTVHDSITMPKGMFARYFRGDGFSNNIIELREDNTYIFYDNSCMVHFDEKGTWTLDNEIITFIPAKGQWSMLEWITKDRKLYLTDDFLVGKKLAKTYIKTGKAIVTETYSYLAKEPN